ncbi:MAG: ferritin family protein [Dehalococcoidia bacterium]
MSTELDEIMETAMYKEVASQAQYDEASRRIEDPGARQLLRELAEEEGHHLKMLKDFKEKGVQESLFDKDRIADLKITEHLTGPDKVTEGAGIQEVLLFAMKREQDAIEFYSRMMGALRTRKAKELCENLVHAELKHKQRLELIYDDLFYQWD